MIDPFIPYNMMYSVFTRLLFVLMLHWLFSEAAFQEHEIQTVIPHDVNSQQSSYYFCILKLNDKSFSPFVALSELCNIAVDAKILCKYVRVERGL